LWKSAVTSAVTMAALFMKTPGSYAYRVRSSLW